jgi:hypothetical protein
VEIGDLDILDKGVELSKINYCENYTIYLLGSLLILITASLKTNTDSLGNVADTLGPDVLVKHGIDSDIPKKRKEKDV